MISMLLILVAERCGTVHPVHLSTRHIQTRIIIIIVVVVKLDKAIHVVHVRNDQEWRGLICGHIQYLPIQILHIQILNIFIDKAVLLLLQLIVVIECCRGGHVLQQSLRVGGIVEPLMQLVICVVVEQQQRQIIAIIIIIIAVILGEQTVLVGRVRLAG